MGKFVLGLTGGIAGGKSVVSHYYGQRGAFIVDADIVSRQVLSDVKMVNRLKVAFPGAVTQGVLDRKKLRTLAFSTRELTNKLNAITHPAIIEECQRQIASRSGWIVFVVPLMFESGLDKLCDATVTVSCPLEKRIKRLISRDNISVKEAQDVIARQMDDEERRLRADYEIVNDGSIDELEAKAEKLAEKLGLIKCAN